jgi:hypothetical protein
VGSLRAATPLHDELLARLELDHALLAAQAGVVLEHHLELAPVSRDRDIARSPRSRFLPAMSSD